MKRIKILGTGCPKCRTLTTLTQEVVKDGNIEAEVIKIDDISEILKYPIPSTPALIVNDELKCFGRIPSREEMSQMLR